MQQQTRKLKNTYHKAKKKMKNASQNTPNRKTISLFKTANELIAIYKNLPKQITYNLINTANMQMKSIFSITKKHILSY